MIHKQFLGTQAFAHRPAEGAEGLYRRPYTNIEDIHSA